MIEDKNPKRQFIVKDQMGSSEMGVENMRALREEHKKEWKVNVSKRNALIVMVTMHC